MGHLRFSRRTVAVFAGAMALSAAVAVQARAQDSYPSRGVTLIIPFAPGGGSDVIARIVGEELGKALGQPVIFENVAGAGGTTGLARAAAAKADGYTLVIGNAGNAAAAYTLYPELKYKPDAFAPLGLVARTASVIALRKDHPGRTMAEFLAKAKAAPDQVKLGHAGVGSSNHLICLSFLKSIGLDLTMVGYRGAGPALNDLIGGHIDGVCDSATSVAPAIQSGNVLGLVVAGHARVEALPNVPSAVDAGIPEFQAGGWNALFAPAGTPQPILDKLNAAVRTALATEFVRTRYRDLVSTVPAADEQTPAFQAAHVPREIERYRALLAGVKP
jgi:tripartite-type tricarboxylate transporter receptor subunit TctC